MHRNEDARVDSQVSSQISVQRNGLPSDNSPRYFPIENARFGSGALPFNEVVLNHADDYAVQTPAENSTTLIPCLI